MAELIDVLVIHSPAPRTIREWPLQLPAGATVLDAVQACNAPELLLALREQGFVVAVWGRKARADQQLRAKDRVEILRPLVVDPKVARRERFKRQGSRAAGLFARRGSTPDEPPS